MLFKIKHGLFKANITDYHAVLGVSLDADPKTIRLKYLRIAQKLHPDTCKGTPKEKEFAGQLLSRLVNPAYEQLSNKSLFAEHQLVLTQIGRRYAEKSDNLNFASKSANTLLKTEKNIAQTYNKILKELSTQQYQDVSKVASKIAAISELNFVYLLLKNQQGLNRGDKLGQQAISQQTKSSPSPTTPEASPPEEFTPQSRVKSYIRRAQEYLAKESINEAITELKDALRLDPNNSQAHALIGQAYLRQNQMTMAKVHIKKAYAVSPQDALVKEIKAEFDKLTKKQEQKSTNKNSKKEKSGDSGFFSGFFSTKKK